MEGSESTEDDWTWDVDDKRILVEDAGGDAVRLMMVCAEGASDGGSNVVFMNSVEACSYNHSLGQMSGWYRGTLKPNPMSFPCPHNARA